MHTLIKSIVGRSDVLTKITSEKIGLWIYPGTVQYTRETLLGKVSWYLKVVILSQSGVCPGSRQRTYLILFYNFYLLKNLKLMVSSGNILYLSVHTILIMDFNILLYCPKLILIENTLIDPVLKFQISGGEVN